MSSGTLVDRIELVSSEHVGRSAFYEQFYQVDSVKLRKDFEGLTDLDCIIIPCSNGFGIKDGVAKDVQPIVTSKLERLARNYIFENFAGEQPAGTAFILEGVGLKKKDAKVDCPNVCWVAVSRTPETLNKDYAYVCVWSSLVAIRRHNKLQKERKKRLNVVACPAISFKSGDVAESCRQVALAVKRFMEPPMEPLEKEDVLRLEESIVRPTTMTLEERAKDLEGLLWSRELESRGICNEQELEILISWVNESSDKDKKGVHSLAAAKALVAMLKRDDTESEFTMTPFQICERMARKDIGCLPRLLDYGLNSELELHKEISRSELEILGKIGDGNAGSVYKGKYKGIDVAIKMFSKGTVNNSMDFKRELAMLSLIKHPLVVMCYGGSTKPGDEFLVEELMEASVYDLLHDENFPMDMEMKLDFAISTGRCMHFLHNCGLIHRDLKSLNLLVSKNYDVKICDFGLSRVLDSKSEMTKNIGTVAWIAPELFGPKRTYTEKADVYSYGVILWELLTRKMPFGEVESFSIPLLVSRGDRPTLPKDTPADWKKLIKVAWHQKPQKRPDFKKVLRRLRAMVDHLKEERIAKGLDLNTQRGLYLRNSSFITDDVYTGSSDDTGSGRISGPHHNSGKDTGTSDSDYDNSTMSSTLSLSLSMSSAPGGSPANSTRNRDR